VCYSNAQQLPWNPRSVVDGPDVAAGEERMPRKIVVKGTSGAGKSTIARDLARRWGLTYIELDALHWGPNWSQPTPEDFQTRVREAMTAAPNGWVIDGNYDSKLGPTVVADADTVLWLDLPLAVELFRLCRRTVRRVRGNVELWNGNRETWRGAVFGRQSLLFWTISAHRRHRRLWPTRLANDPRWVRLRSTAAIRRWIEEQDPAEEERER
jgi:adenylate kinase family enzyme